MAPASPAQACACLGLSKRIRYRSLRITVSVAESATTVQVGMFNLSVRESCRRSSSHGFRQGCTWMSTIRYNPIPIKVRNLQAEPQVDGAMPCRDGHLARDTPNMVRTIQQQSGCLRNKNGWNPAMLAPLLDCGGFQVDLVLPRRLLSILGQYTLGTGSLARENRPIPARLDHRRGQGALVRNSAPR